MSVYDGHNRYYVRVGRKSNYHGYNDHSKTDFGLFSNNRLWSVLRIDFGLFSMPGSCIFLAYSVYNMHSLYHMAGI